MNRFLLAGLAALALAVTATPARADCCFQYSCCRNLSYVHTSKNRCFTFNSHSNPLSCAPGGGYAGPALWNGLAAYGPAAYPAAVAAAPAAAAPGATTPSFKAPQPAPATKSSNGVQQAGYFYYGQTNNAGYGYNAGYNYGASYGYGYGYGYGASYAQAPNYWY